MRLSFETSKLVYLANIGNTAFLMQTTLPARSSRLRRELEVKADQETENGDLTVVGRFSRMMT